MNAEIMIGLVRAWFSEWEPRWRSLSVQPQLKVPADARLSKVVATLDGPSHAASLTVWGGGTVEFIVLNVVSQQETVMADYEFDTPEALRRLLDDAAESFRRIVDLG